MKPSLMSAMPQQFKIHRAGIAELDTVWKIIAEYYQAAGVIARDAREDLARLHFAEGSGVWLATGQGQVVGSIALRPLPQMGASAEVKRLYVQAAFRGQGIAAALHAALQEYARDFGYGRLYLDTTNEMTAAIHFYERLGYERCARYNKNPQATIFMQKTLERSGRH
jgi:GNAT superfamily N-acetyltransferase